MAITHQIQKIRPLLQRAAEEKLVLPNFQREYVWNPEAQKTLVASLLCDVPAGSVLILNGRRDDYAARQVGKVVDANPTEECEYLLDGQQRLSTLRCALRSPFDELDPSQWRTAWDSIPDRLRYHWTLAVTPDSDHDEDPFGWRTLTFPRPFDAEPSEISDFITGHKILVKEQNSPAAWYHPNWMSTSGSADRRLALAKAAATEGSVPLWALDGQDGGSLVGLTLQLISHQRASELQAEWANSVEARDALYPALRNASPALPSEHGDAAPNEIASAFSALAAAWKEDVQSFLFQALEREVPAVILSREDLHRAVAIFEVINQGGTPLTPFDLVVARHARNRHVTNLAQKLGDLCATTAFDLCESVADISLSQVGMTSWEPAFRRFGTDKGALTSTFKNAFLNLLSIEYVLADSDLSDLDVKHTKRSEILKLPHDAIEGLWERVATALLRAYCVLQFRGGIRAESDLRYKLMVLPVAHALFANPEWWDDKKRIDQIEYWYWVTMFSGAYRERQNENTIADIKGLYDWLCDPADDFFDRRRGLVLAASGYSDREALLLEGPDAAIGSDIGSLLLQYVLSGRPQDWLPEGPSHQRPRLEAWGEEPLDDHHILPIATATSLKESAATLRSSAGHPLNSPLNRTYVSAHANRSIGTRSPGQYLNDVGDAGFTGHYVPTNASSFPAAGAPDYLDQARGFLSDRFDRLRDGLIDELDNRLHP